MEVFDGVDVFDDEDELLESEEDELDPESDDDELSDEEPLLAPARLSVR